MKRAAALVAAGIVALSLAFVGTATADEHHGKQCAFGEASGNGTAVINTFVFEVCRTGGKTTDVTGNFRAAGVPPTNFIVLNGPVTCAEFRGNSVGFIYPVVEGSNAPGLENNVDVLISATDSGPGRTDMITFTPLPRLPNGAVRTNCAPTLLGAPQPVTQGDIVVESRG